MLGVGIPQCPSIMTSHRSPAAHSLRPNCTCSNRQVIRHFNRQHASCLHAQQMLGASGPHLLIESSLCKLSFRRRVSTVVNNAIVQEAEPSSSGEVGTSASSVPTSAEWELDFCSRPLLDERGKKVWELLICDTNRQFEYSRYFPNNKINSAELKRAIQEVIAQDGAVAPKTCRFFRGQMQTIITKALTELEIKAVPSRRCFTIMSWLNERIDTVYTIDPRYKEGATSLFQLDLPSPEPLPDALRGEQWAFVQLPLALLQNMLKKVESGEVFGSTFDLSTVGADKLQPNALVPGVAVFTRRALPLAAWTNGLELAALKADAERACLILETGVNQRWRYGAWRATKESTEEAESWEDAKNDTNGLHFLAVQPDPESEVLTGLWLLYDKPPPSI